MEKLMFIIAICAVITFVICLSLLIYHADDRKQLQKEIDDINHRYDILFDKYFKSTINNSILKIKLDLFEKYLLLESSDDDE